MGGGVIVTEPTDNIINPTEGGLEWVRIHIEGVSSHAGWRYSDIYPGYSGEGVNAIEKATKIIAAVQDLERTWGSEKVASSITLWSYHYKSRCYYWRG